MMPERALLIDALEKLRSAIDLLDQAEAPAQIAAHADLAASQLDDLLARPERTGQLDRRFGLGPVQPL
jgi:hypothetical protein